MNGGDQERVAHLSAIFTHHVESAAYRLISPWFITLSGETGAGGCSERVIRSGSRVEHNVARTSQRRRRGRATMRYNAGQLSERAAVVNVKKMRKSRGR